MCSAGERTTSNPGAFNPLRMITGLIEITIRIGHTGRTHPTSSQSALRAETGTIRVARDNANLSDPDVLAREIMEELKVALEQFSEIVEELREEEEG